MGSEVVIRCPCGLSSRLFIGGGMATHEEICLFPCFCERCRKLVQVNLLAQPRHCPACHATEVIPYDDPALTGRIGPHEVASWNVEKPLGRRLVLTDGTYKCPDCGKMTLRFSHSGVCWD